MRPKSGLVAAVFLLFFFASSAQILSQATSDLSLSAMPGASLPMGPAVAGGVPFYTFGGGVSVEADYSPRFLPMSYGGLQLDARLLPINGTPSVATFLALGPQLGIQLFPSAGFGVRVFGFGGMYMGMIKAGSVTNPFAGGGVELAYQVTPSLAISLGASYRYLFTPTGPAYHGIDLAAGTRYYVGGDRPALNIVTEIEPVFPLFYSYYDRNPVGTVTVHNAGRAPVKELRVSLFVKEHMDSPKSSDQVVESLGQGQEARIAVNALFKNTVFAVTTATKVTGEVRVTYKYLGAERSSVFPVSVIINSRNGMTWDDTRKAAGFVTPKDERVRDFALRYAADARSRGGEALNATLRVAIALFNALKEHGVGYVADPATPFTETSANGSTVDFLQFPVESLAYKAGDCDDLSILYAALLEATGTEAAFVTTPGHIFVAFNTGFSQRSAAQVFSDPQAFISRNDEVWVPVEVTRVKDGFVRAWQTGAQEWNAARSAGQAEMHSLREAWGVYPPAFTGQIVSGSLATPDPVQVFASYGSEMARLRSMEMEPREASLLEEIGAGSDTAETRNRLGVLYARFGEIARARAQFELVVRTVELPSALVNLGNIAYLDGQYAQALDYYRRALAVQPDSPIALLGFARAAYELGQAGSAKDALDRLGQVDPALAARHAWLGSADSRSRAATAEKEVSEWDAD